MRKSTRIVKKLLALFLVVLMSINTLGAVVSDNDGSAFITKAEFDSLKNDFQSQIDRYNSSLDNKIDGAIASYLAGIKVESKQMVNVNNAFLSWPLHYYHHNVNFENLPPTTGENTVYGHIGEDSLFEPSYFYFGYYSGNYRTPLETIRVAQKDRITDFYDIIAVGDGSTAVIRNTSTGWKSALTLASDGGVHWGDNKYYYPNIALGLTKANDAAGRPWTDTVITLDAPSSYIWRYDLYSDGTNEPDISDWYIFSGITPSRTAYLLDNGFQWFSGTGGYPNGSWSSNTNKNWTTSATKKNSIDFIFWNPDSVVPVTYYNESSKNSVLYLYNKRPCATLHTNFSPGTYYVDLMIPGLTPISENEAPTISWDKKNLIKASRLSYEWSAGNSKYKTNLCDGVPIFDMAAALLNGTVKGMEISFTTSALPGFENTDRTIVFSRKPIVATRFSDVDLTSNDLYRIDSFNGSTLFNAKYVTTKCGNHKFKLSGFEKNDIVYFKVFWNSSLISSDVSYNDYSIDISKPELMVDIE